MQVPEEPEPPEELVAWFWKAAWLDGQDGRHSFPLLPLFRRVKVAFKHVLSMSLDGLAFAFCCNSNLASFYFSGLRFGLLQ